MRNHHVLALTSALLFLSGCFKVPDNSGSTSVSPEPTFCSTFTNYTGNTTLVDATAMYDYRAVTINGLDSSASSANIRGAEVQVINSSGSIIQCGTTSVTGVINVTIPRTAGTYTLKVLSRADSALVRARVLDSPIDNKPYSISTSFTLVGNEVTKSVALPHASHTGTLEGGAFNILDQVYKAVTYLKANSGNCAGCTAVTDVPTIPIFWKPGLSPAAYFDQPNVAVSFYLKSANSYLKRGLYMLGGQAGIVDCADTDHFDNSVILHEYGHYLEDQFSGSESPGGSHNGNFIIDPRLAWSEGWANYVQSEFLSTTNYRDTIGNPSCATPSESYLAINLDLAAMQNHQDRMPQNYTANSINYLNSPYYFPATIVNGEGIFREVSVARALKDFTTLLGFDEIWEIFSGTTNGLADSSVVFRNVGTYNEKLRDYISTNSPGSVVAFDSAVSAEYQLSDRTVYAQPVTAQALSCPVDMTPVRTIGNGEALFSHLERSNDFYEFYYGGGSLTLTMKYQAVAGVGSAPEDLDIYIYTTDHTLGDSGTMAGYSESSALVGNIGTETVIMTGKAPGKYLINVRAYVEGSSPPFEATRYYIETQTGNDLCP